MTPSGLELRSSASHLDGVTVVIRSGQEPDQTPVARVVGEPGVIEAVVDQAGPDHGPFVRRQRLELVQRIRGSSGSTGRGAQQGKTLDPVRCGDGELLSHHAAEAHPENPRRIPSDDVHQGQCVGRTSGHVVGLRSGAAGT